MPKLRFFLSPQTFYKSYVNPLSENGRTEHTGATRDGAWGPLHPLVDSGGSTISGGTGLARLYHCGGAVPGIDVEEQSILVMRPKHADDRGDDLSAAMPVRDGRPGFGLGSAPFLFSSLELHSVREESECSSSAGSSRADQDGASWRTMHSGGRGLSLGASPGHQLHLWEEPDAEVDPAPSWSDLSNRSLMCKPLPLEVGRCQCYIIREKRDGKDTSSVYSLHTNEGRGRHDRRLAVARHRYRGGRSEFIMAQSGFGTIRHQLEEGYIGTVSANLMGTRYRIWDQGKSLETHGKDRKLLLGAVVFEPSATSMTGKYRRMRVFTPKYQSMQFGCKKNEQIGLAEDYEDNTTSVFRLCSRASLSHKETARKEADFRERLLKTGFKIKSSAKNVQLTLEETGQQVILLLGKTSNSTYIMEYRYPLTAQQAFGICLASLDSKPYWRLACL